MIAADLADEATPRLIAERVEAEHGRLDLLVNNAGIRGRGSFADGGWAEVRRVMATNFDAQVRLTEALLPLLRRSAPSGVVNVGSVAGRVSRPRAGAYSASKFALAGWTEALQMEEVRHGVHVALVQPGFVDTEGLPQPEMLARPWTRWMVSTEAKVAEAVLDVWRRRRPECYVPRPYGLVPVARVLLPGLYRRASGRRLHDHAEARRASAASGNVCPVDDGFESLIVGVAVSPSDVAANHVRLLGM